MFGMLQEQRTKLEIGPDHSDNRAAQPIECPCFSTNAFKVASKFERNIPAFKLCPSDVMVRKGGVRNRFGEAPASSKVCDQCRKLSQPSIAFPAPNLTDIGDEGR